MEENPRTVAIASFFAMHESMSKCTTYLRKPQKCLEELYNFRRRNSPTLAKVLCYYNARHEKAISTRAGYAL